MGSFREFEEGKEKGSGEQVGGSGKLVEKLLQLNIETVVAVHPADSEDGQLQEEAVTVHKLAQPGLTLHFSGYEPWPPPALRQEAAWREDMWERPWSSTGGGGLWESPPRPLVGGGPVLPPYPEGASP